MPYKKKRKELSRQHYLNNIGYYQKKSNQWKKDNVEKVRAGKIRYNQKKKIVNQLNHLQKLYFKTDRSKKAADDFLETNENELYDILKDIIIIQHFKLTKQKINENLLKKICKSFFSTNNERNARYLDNIEYIVFKVWPPNKKFDISVQTFNKILYDPILNEIKDEIST